MLADGLNTPNTQCFLKRATGVFTLITSTARRIQPTPKSWFSTEEQTFCKRVFCLALFAYCCCCQWVFVVVVVAEPERRTLQKGKPCWMTLQILRSPLISLSILRCRPSNQIPQTTGCWRLTTTAMWLFTTVTLASTVKVRGCTACVGLWWKNNNPGLICYFSLQKVKCCGFWHGKRFHHRPWFGEWTRKLSTMDLTLTKWSPLFKGEAANMNHFLLPLTVRVVEVQL